MIVIFSFSGQSVCSYVYAELTRGYMLEHDEAKYHEKRERIYNVFKIPVELEKVGWLSDWPIPNCVTLNDRILRPQPKSWGPIELGGGVSVRLSVRLSVCLAVIAFLYGLELLNERS